MAADHALLATFNKLGLNQSTLAADGTNPGGILMTCEESKVPVPVSSSFEDVLDRLQRVGGRAVPRWNRAVEVAQWAHIYDQTRWQPVFPDLGHPRRAGGDRRAERRAGAGSGGDDAAAQANSRRRAGRSH